MIRLARWCLVAGGGIGALGLLAWSSGVGPLTAIVPGQPPMMPNTALAVLLIGLAGALRVPEHSGRVPKAVSILAALVVLVVGVGTLAEYLLAVDLGLDRALIRTGLGPHPGRPSPLTALALTLLSAALLAFDSRPAARFRPSECLVLLAAAAAFTALVGFAFGAGPLYRLMRAPVIGVALPTAVALLLVSFGMLLARPAGGLTRVATSPGPGGVLMRRLVIPALVAPAVLGIAIARIASAFDAGETSLEFAVLAATSAVTSLVLLTLAAAPLNRAQSALEASRARTRDLVELAPDGIFVADLEGRYTDVNDAGCRMLGYTREEIVGKTILDLIPPEEVDRLWQSRQEMLGGGTHVAEWHARRKDGSYLTIEVSATILADGRWQGFVRDISERKRAEENLRLAEARSTGILSISADAIISVDGDQRITMFNEGAERVFGYTRDEAMGVPLDTLIPERLRAAHRRHVQQFAAGEQIARAMGQWGGAIVGLRKNGQEFPADAAISKLTVAGTTILTITLRDISAQKRSEWEQRFLAEAAPILAASLEYEETLSRLAQLAARELADFCIVDLVDETGQLRRVEVACHDPRADGIGERLLSGPPDRKPAELFRAAFEKKQPILIEAVTPEILSTWARDEDELRTLQAVAPISVIAVPLVARERLLGVLKLFSSTPSRSYGRADLRLAEELARRAALLIDNARLYRAAKHAVRERDDVLGIVAHDLRNPLGAILMYASALRKGGPAAGPGASRPADLIERAASRMNRLIGDLLDVTRLEAGRLSVEPERVPAARVVADALDAQKAVAAASSCALDAELAPDLPDVWADRDRLLQIFENLVGNALKFTDPGGRITIGATPRDGELMFWVGDTGHGMSAEEVAHVFDRFWQARKADRRGAGLGLPIVKGIVEAHGGRIWVVSTPDRGSTIFFTLPAAPPAAERQAEPP
jgi:PAS domain S-box-containing protein